MKSLLFTLQDNTITTITGAVIFMKRGNKHSVNDY